MFDELRIKSILKKNLSKEAYSKLSDNIKYDDRVISHLLKCDSEGINVLDFHQAKEYLLKDYSLVNSLGVDKLKKYFVYLDLSKLELSADLFVKLNESGRRKVLEYSVSLYFELLPKEERVSKLCSYINEYYTCKFENKTFSLDLESLNKMIYELEGKELVQVLEHNYYVKEHVKDIIKTYDFDKLLELYEENKEVIGLFDDITKRKISIVECNDNLEEIIKLDLGTQVLYFKYNVNKLRYASREVIECFLGEYENLDSSLLIKLGYAHLSEYVKKLPKEEQMKLFSYNFNNVYLCTRGYMASFTLDDIMYDKICKINDVEKRKELLFFYKTLEEEKINEWDSYIYHNQKYQISRMLYDDNIINNNSIELLEEYRDSYDKRILIDILSNAYGEHVRDIFNSRPYLNLFDIDNFKIFDKKIYDKLGSGFIHYLLNCKLGNLNNIIGKLVENEELFDKFVDYFKCITDDKKTLDINIITNLLEKFMLHEEVLKNIDYGNISISQRNILNLFVEDSNYLTICVQNNEDLDNYMDLRRKRFIEIGRNLEYRDDIKNLIFSYVTGQGCYDDKKYDSDGNEKMFIESLTLESAIGVFNIDNIINNEEIISEIGLSKDEVAILLLLHEVNRIYDIDVLRNTFEALVNRNLDSIIFRNTFDKIKEYYIDDVKKGLLSKDKIESLPKRNIEGIEVIDFKGEDFSLICSVQGLNLSTGGNRRDNDTGKVLLNEWLKREDGCSIISTSLVSSDTEIYPLNKEDFEIISNHMIFVFDSDVSIIGMGGSDISSEHEFNPTKHYFRFIGDDNHDTGFSTMDELKDRINKNKRESSYNNKFNSEITITRKEEDVRKEESGKRVMPIALYVIGDIKEEHLETARVFNDYYEKNGLGKFRIIRVDSLVYKGEGVKVSVENDNMYSNRR